MTSYTPAQIAAGQMQAEITYANEGKEVDWSIHSDEWKAARIADGMAVVQAHNELSPPWFEPRPISEARPEWLEILAWDGERWHKCWWDDHRYASKPRPFWRPTGFRRDGDAREVAATLTHFIQMPPAP